MLLRDPNGQIVLPGRVSRTLTDPCMTGVLPSWQTVAAGTMAFENFSGQSVAGRNKITSGAVSGNAGAIKTVAPLMAIKPSNFTALMLTLEGCSLDEDAGMDFIFGFHPQAGSKGGCELVHLNGETKAKVRTFSAAEVQSDTEVNFIVLSGAGGSRTRRNLSFVLLPRGYGGLFATPFAYVLLDDQVVVEQSLSGTTFDKDVDVVPIWQVTTREAKAHTLFWSQVKLTVNHN